MATFNVTYSNGKSITVTTHDCDSVEAYCLSHFGMTHEEVKQCNASVVMVQAENDATPTPAPAEQAPAAPSTDAPAAYVMEVETLNVGSMLS